MVWRTFAAMKWECTAMATLELVLIRAIIQYDRRQKKKQSFDPTALGKYIANLEKTLSFIEIGVPVSTALKGAFKGNLLKSLLEAAEPFERAALPRNGM